MSLIDFILNLAGLLLWLNWRAAPLDPLAKATPATLIGTLRRAEPTRVKRWHFLAALGGLIYLRAVFYWQLGPALNWTARLDVGATRLPFQSDFFYRMLLFSVLSYAVMLTVFFLWLLLVSLLGRGEGESFFLPRLARVHLGRVEGWPVWLKALLPLFAGTLLWWALTWALPAWGLTPRPISGAHRLAQAALVGLSAYLTWKYLVTGLLALHLMNSYVFFGQHAIWNYANAAARRLLAPLRPLPLRAGKVDFAPVVGIALVLVAAHFAEVGLAKLYVQLSR